MSTFEKTMHTEARGVVLSTLWIFVVCNIIIIWYAWTWPELAA